jgi:3-phenylpropionate/cinnamic acid dioxygenase small subunit
MMVHLTVADRLEIHELAARYGTAVDDRDWDGLAAVFTVDATFELVGFGSIDDRYEGLDAIRALMEKGSHPVAHHVTNVMVEQTGDVVRLRSKIVGTLARGGAGSADYADVLRLTPAGWRIARRVVTLRHPPP